MTGTDLDAMIAARLKAADALLHTDDRADADAVGALVETLERDRRRRRGWVRLLLFCVVFASGLAASLLLPLMAGTFSGVVGDAQQAVANAPDAPLASAPAIMTAAGLLTGLGLLVLMLQTAGE